MRILENGLKQFLVKRFVSNLRFAYFIICTSIIVDNLHRWTTLWPILIAIQPAQQHADNISSLPNRQPQRTFPHPSESSCIAKQRVVQLWWFFNQRINSSNNNHCLCPLTVTTHLASLTTRRSCRATFVYIIAIIAIFLCILLFTTTTSPPGCAISESSAFVQN